MSTDLSPNTGAAVTDVPHEESAFQAAELRFARAQYREFLGQEFRWAVYASDWPEKWGRSPMLGTVVADTKELALYRAYDRGIANPSNCSFGYKFKNLGPVKKTSPTP